GRLKGTESRHFMASDALTRIRSIRDELNRMFLERAELIDGALAALLSHSHVLLIGPPGTAKSMLAEELCTRIEGARYFQWLLTRFSTPEELFGAVSLKGLEQDDYRRVTTHKLPEAHIAFLDEIFKANSSILNALLTLINERIFHNGRERVAVPLVTLFGASNELPDEEELTALYDRFMFRFITDYISEDFRFLKMLEGGGDGVRTALAGRSAVVEDDLMFLEHVLWKDPEERPKVREVLRRLVRGFEEEARELLIQSQELRDYTQRQWESEEMRKRALVEAHTKIANILVKFETLLQEASEAGRAIEGAEAMRSEVREIQQAMLRRAMGA